MTNPIRTAMLNSAIEECRNGDCEVNFENLKSKLPDDFDLGTDEVPEPKMRETWSPSAGEVVVEEVADVTILQSEAVPDESAPAEPLSEDDTLAAIQQWENRLHSLNAEHRASGERLRRERARMADVILIFQTDGSPPITPTENVKQVLATWQEERRLIAEGVIPPKETRRPGRSYLDRVRAAQTGGSAADYVRGRMTNGGARRGAYPGSMKHRKLPSQR